MTNEETDQCAARYRQFMSTKQEDLQKSLMTKCVSSTNDNFEKKALEVCTDSCKSEADLTCINKCGSKYLKDLHDDFEKRLSRYGRELDKLN